MAATATRGPRALLGRVVPASPAGFATLASLLVAAIWINIASGAWVRVTGSGLGCPDWPTCHGAVTPPSSYHAAIEFSNRALALGVIAVAIVAFAAARRASDAANRRLALAAGLLTLGQAPLGALTVHFDLNPWLVLSHFLVAIVVAALAAIVWSRARLSVTRAPAAMRRPPWVRPAAAGFVAAAAGLILTGALTTNSGTHPGDDSARIRRIWNLADAAYLHVRVAFAFAALLVLLLVVLRRAELRPPGYGRLAAALLVLVAVQITIGEVQWRTQLPSGLVLAHVATAAALWIAVVVFAARAWGASRPSA